MSDLTNYNPEKPDTLFNGNSQISQSMTRLYNRIDKISEDNMRLRNFWERIFQTKIQKAVQQATIELIQEQAQARGSALRAVHNAQLRSLHLNLEDALARAAIEKKASGIIHLTNRRQEAEAAINAAAERAFEEFALRLQQAEKIPLPKVRKLRIASLEEAMERFMDLTTKEVMALDRIIEDYSSS